MQNEDVTTKHLSEGDRLQTTPDIKSGHGVRFGAVMPIAAGVTIGLTMSMAALIATEFTPQDKSETASYEINPKVEDIKVLINETKIDELKTVITPPPPPQIERAKADKPTVKIVSETGKIHKFVKPVINKANYEVIVDSSAKPLLRIPPVFPARFLQGNMSGYCQVRFDVNPQGQPFNVSTALCTNNQLMAPTVKSVQKWKYTPKIVKGHPVTRSGLETTIRFDLQDEQGQTLPVPAGY